MAGDERLETPARIKEVRDAVGRGRRFDEELAHTTHKVALRVPRLGANQFCRVQVHAHLPSMSPEEQKTREPTRAAAGKCLHRLDLPLASARPSPPLHAQPSA